MEVPVSFADVAKCPIDGFSDEIPVVFSFSQNQGDIMFEALVRGGFVMEGEAGNESKTGPLDEGFRTRCPTDGLGVCIRRFSEQVVATLITDIP